jgi:hypothetical protein
LDGQRTPNEQLADAVETLSAAAGQAPRIALGRGAVSSSISFQMTSVAGSLRRDRL